MSENIEEKIQKASTTLAMMLDYLGLEAGIKSREKNGRIHLTTVSEDAGRIIGRRGKTLEDLQLLINKMMNKGDDSGAKIVIDVDGYSKKSPSRRPHGDEAPSGEVREGGDESEPGSEERRPRFRRDSGGRDGGSSRPRFRGDSRRSGDRGGDRGGERGGYDEPRVSDEERENVVRQQAVDASKEVKKWGEPVSLPPMNSRDRRIVHMALQEDQEIVSESRETDNPKLKSVVISLKK